LIRLIIPLLLSISLAWPAALLAAEPSKGEASEPSKTLEGRGLRALKDGTYPPESAGREGRITAL
jgi:hypothetical protein